MTRTRWASAGVRVDQAETRKRAGQRNANQFANVAMLERAKAAWARGEMKPAGITLMLDMNGLEGPEVDTACLAAEPDVDNWEAGTLYPSWEQVVALAELVGCSPEFFMWDRHYDENMQTSMRFHGTKAEREAYAKNDAPLIMKFTPEAIQKTLAVLA